VLDLSELRKLTHDADMILDNVRKITRNAHSVVDWVGAGRGASLCI
jgi:hypothetical protein